MRMTIHKAVGCVQAVMIETIIEGYNIWRIAEYAIGKILIWRNHTGVVHFTGFIISACLAMRDHIMHHS